LLTSEFFEHSLRLASAVPPSAGAPSRATTEEVIRMVLKAQEAAMPMLIVKNG
jgi:hypothetical protein